MPKKVDLRHDPRDATLRVSKAMRASLKAAAAVMGRPLYDVTNEAMERYLGSLKWPPARASIRHGRTRKTS